LKWRVLHNKRNEFWFSFWAEYCQHLFSLYRVYLPLFRNKLLNCLFKDFLNTLIELPVSPLWFRELFFHWILLQNYRSKRREKWERNTLPLWIYHKYFRNLSIELFGLLSY
jgi:hypothetical protein